MVKLMDNLTFLHYFQDPKNIFEIISKMFQN